MSKPRVIIGMLEDSPPQLDQRLVAAYLATIYWVSWPDKIGFYLTLGSQKSAFTDFLEQKNISDFGIITACNPHSQLLESPENTHRNQLLHQDLLTCTTLLLPAQNISPDNSWPVEHGFCAAGMQPGDLIALGQKYGQNAVLGWEKGRKLELWWL